jgi:hypothetical protein
MFQIRSSSETVQKAKRSLGIKKDDSNLTTDEVRSILIAIGKTTPDVTFKNGKPVFNDGVLKLLFSIAITHFPEVIMANFLEQVEREAFVNLY